MTRRNRPTAFDVSFPEEVEAMAAEELEEAAAPKPIHPYAADSRSPSVASSSALKRKNDGPGDMRAIKRLQLPPVEYYQKRREELIEDSELVITGEDPEDGLDDGEKPIRLLSDFSIFDPKHRNEFISLAAIEEDDGMDRQFEGAGMVMPYFVSEEDEGQNEEEMNIEPQYVRLSVILRYTVDYAQESEPFYIETQYAWYILKRPSQKYLPHYRHFYTPRRIAQLVISSALKRPTQNWDAFVAAFTLRVDMFGKTYLKEHLSDSAKHQISEIQEAVLNEPECKKIMSAPFVRYLLSTAPSPDGRSRKSTRNGPRNKHLPRNKALIGNPDLAVLKAENQNSTHVTPRIAALAEGLVREELIVVGPPPPARNKDLMQVEKKKAYDHLCRLIAKAKKRNKDIDYKKEDRVSVHSEFYKAVEVEKEIYRIGDVVLIPNGTKARWEDPALQRSQIRIPPDARIDDFFWFGKIQYVYMEVQRAHVQWLNHGSYTVMSELALKQELFLSDECGEVDVSKIVGKVTVHERPSTETVIKPHEYFCKFMYDPVLSTFTSMDVKRLTLAAAQEPPNNCPACLLNEQRDHEKETRELKDEHGNKHGVAFAGVDYHLEDFVLYRAETGPANIGYVIKIQVANESVTVRKVGRISSLDGILPNHIVRDERHLYLTDEKVVIPVNDLIKVIYAPCLQSFQPPYATLDDWKELSYDHFYLKYNFPKLKVKSWTDKKTVTWQELLVCTPCCKERLKGRKTLYKFLEHSERQPLPTLDLFGGVGAFSRGLQEGSGCLKVTHAIEISPSAATTFMRNSPDTVVYNQCANTMLRYAIKTQEGHHPEVPKQLFDDKISIPDAPQRGAIKVITAGFPCQTHSTLNMFKDADDVKSNLILTTLSFLDYYRPALAFFENVPGFLNYSLNATQADQYRVEGGLEMGGLKLLVRALIDMGYQVRYGLLQAGHYGAPQRRVRFFLIAAEEGQELPDLPQPTHEFPVVNPLQIKHSKQDNRMSHTIRPIRTTKGTAAHPFVTIEAAIGDLPQFDWKNPRPERESAAKKRERREREREIPSLECKISEPYCGFRGQIGYHHEPRTTYQQNARLVPTQDLQQYTKCLLANKVERVLHIPLNAGADYRSLPPDQFEWQFADPSSSIARAKYRPGVYGRLDKDGFFPTTVTNMDPTAKQCRVLHPSCHRMVTVRELARSQGFPDNFVFEAIGQNVVTMHRQIGNAVPIPVAHALGRELRKVLYQKWKANLDEAIWIDEDEADEHHLGIADDSTEVHESSDDDDDSDRMDTD